MHGDEIPEGETTRRKSSLMRGAITVSRSEATRLRRLVARYGDAWQASERRDLLDLAQRIQVATMPAPDPKRAAMLRGWRLRIGLALKLGRPGGRMRPYPRPALARALWHPETGKVSASMVRAWESCEVPLPAWLPGKLRALEQGPPELLVKHLRSKHRGVNTKPRRPKEL